jgi:hypothetical protein
MLVATTPLCNYFESEAAQSRIGAAKVAVKSEKQHISSARSCIEAQWTDTKPSVTADRKWPGRAYANVSYPTSQRERQVSS